MRVGVTLDQYYNLLQSCAEQCTMHIGVYLQQDIFQKLFLPGQTIHALYDSNSRTLYFSYLAAEQRVHALRTVSYGWSAVTYWMWILLFSDIPPIFFWLKGLSSRFTNCKGGYWTITKFKYCNYLTACYIGNVMLTKMIVNWLKNVWKETWRNTYV